VTKVGVPVGGKLQCLVSLFNMWAYYPSINITAKVVCNLYRKYSSGIRASCAKMKITCSCGKEAFADGNGRYSIRNIGFSKLHM
jgi:hypothetical protein